MKNIIRQSKRIGVTLLVSSAVFASPFSVATTSTDGLVSTNSSVSLSCDFNIPEADDICGAVSSIEQLLNGNFSIGGCNISTTSNSDFFDDLKKRCTEALGDDKKGVMSPLNPITTSSNEYKLIKGSKGKDCKGGKELKDIKHPSGLTNEEIEKKTPIEEMGNRYGIFSSSIDDVRDCMKMHGEKCKEPGYMKLPEDSVETEKQIVEAAQHIAVSDESVAANLASVEAEYQKKLAECNDKEDKAKDDCKQEVEYGKESIGSIAKKQVSKIEIASAAEFKTMNKAARGSTYYVYKDSESMDKMPEEVANEYSDGVARQNAADILIDALYKETVNLKKNSIMLGYGKVEAVSSAYDPKAPIEDLKAYLARESNEENTAE
ncbi:MAG: hypothetical protein IE916_00225 [Epsilonproteobacteria bacterium]|nr:hypothetical protein [Campylobacterota bacterium]